MMLRKIIPTMALGGVICVTLGLSGCFESYPAYGGGYAYPAYSPGYVYQPPVVVGDYDEAHHWHDRDWWVQNRHPWVQQHHPDWLTARQAAHTGYGHNEHD
jgi:hypothetical protein